MQNQSKTDRRNFLMKAATAVGSVISARLAQREAQGQKTGAGTKTTEPSSLLFENLYDTSVLSTTLKGEAADRLALRRLVDAWAHCADRRLAQEQANLFVPDGIILNYEGEPKNHEPHSIIKGRTEIRAALAVLNTFTVTLHMNGQSDSIIQGNRAIGQTYCLVHQFTMENHQRKCQTLGIRYYDQFLRESDRWYFAERKLIIDWTDSRMSVP